VAHISDRWFRTVRGEDGSSNKEKTERHGDGKRYRVRYLDPSGAERSKSFDKKGDAEFFLTEVKAELQRGTYVDPQAGKITLRKYAEDWLAGQTFEATTRERVRQRLDKHILPSLGDKTLGSIAGRPSTVQAWMRGLDLAPSSVHGVFAALSAILSAALDDGLIGRNPCHVKSVKRPKIVRRKLVPWTTEQVAAVRDRMPERYRVLSDAGSGLGLRQGEAFGLSPDDVNWPRADSVHVRRQVRIVGSRLCFAPPKRGREREVPLPESVKLRLSAHLSAYPAIPVTLPWLEPGGRPVTVRLAFTTTARNALDRAYFHRLWREAREKAGLANERENGFHALRHYYASLLLHGGEDIRSLSEWLGHYDPAFTLRIYSHLMPAAGRRARGVVDEALNPGCDGPDTASASAE
jgi:integrase